MSQSLRRARLGTEPLEARVQPALFALNLPGLSLLVATQEPVVANVVIVRGANLFIELSPRANDSASPVARTPSLPDVSTSVPSPSTPTSSIGPVSISRPASNTVVPTPRSTVSTASAPASVASPILLPPDVAARVGEATSPTAFNARSLQVPASLLLPVVNEAVALPSSPLAATGAASAFIPALAPPPQDRETAVGPAFSPPVEVAPMPREVNAEETETRTIVAPMFVTEPESPAAPVPTVETTAQPEAAATNWGWWGGMAAVLLAGGYWMLRQVRLSRSRGPAAYRRLPAGTILSTDLQPAW